MRTKWQPQMSCNADDTPADDRDFTAFLLTTHSDFKGKNEKAFLSCKSIKIIHEQYTKEIVQTYEQWPR